MWCCLCDPTFCRFSRTPACDRQTDTDGHRPMASTADAQHRAVKIRHNVNLLTNRFYKIWNLHLHDPQQDARRMLCTDTPLTTCWHWPIFTISQFKSLRKQLTAARQKNRLGYKNNWLVVAYQPHQQLMEVYGDGWRVYFCLIIQFPFKLVITVQSPSLACCSPIPIKDDTVAENWAKN